MFFGELGHVTDNIFFCVFEGWKKIYNLLLLVAGLDLFWGLFLTNQNFVFFFLTVNCHKCHRVQNDKPI